MDPHYSELYRIWSSPIGELPQLSSQRIPLCGRISGCVHIFAARVFADEWGVLANRGMTVVLALTTDWRDTLKSLRLSLLLYFLLRFRVKGF